MSSGPLAPTGISACTHTHAQTLININQDLKKTVRPTKEAGGTEPTMQQRPPPLQKISRPIMFCEGFHIRPFLVSTQFGACVEDKKTSWGRKEGSLHALLELFNPPRLHKRCIFLGDSQRT